MLTTMLNKASDINGNGKIVDLSKSKQQDLLNNQVEYYKLRDDYQRHQQQLK